MYMHMHMHIPGLPFPLGGEMVSPGRLSITRKYRGSRERGVASDLRSTEVPAFRSETRFVCHLHGRCLLSLTPGNHAYICTANSFRSECIFRTMSLEKKSSNACQKMDNGKANYLGLDLLSINQMSKGKILGVPAFPRWVQSRGKRLCSPRSNTLPTPFTGMSY